MTSFLRRNCATARSSRKAKVAFALLATVSLTAGACSRSDSSVESGSSTTAAGGSTTAPSGTAGPGDFGDLKDVCGPGDAKGATAQGVTDSDIEVGTVSDPGFTARPGLNQELFDAGKVFSDWCNAAGGINGRKLKVDFLDAKLTEYKQRITEGCAKDFFLVGGGAVFDQTGQDERLKCLLPDVPAYLVSAKARGAELTASPLPTALDETAVGVFQYLDKKFPDSTSKVGFITGNVASTILVDKQNQEAVKQLGWKVLYQSQYNALGESTWTPFAQSLKSKGIKGLVYTGEPENMAKLLQAIDDIGYKLDWTVVGANHLDAKFIEVGGKAVHGVYMYSAVVPFFEADKNPASQQYKDLFAKYLPKGKSEALLGVNSFSAWLLFATAVKACGSDVTRKCVYEKASATSSWTGGGLHAESDPSSRKAPRCGIVVEGTPDGFIVPKDFKLTDGLFRCADDSVATLTGDYGKGATLSSVGKSLADLK